MAGIGHLLDSAAMGAVLATVVIAAVVLAAAAGGVTAVAVVAVGVGLIALVDGARLFALLGARPVLPAALVPVVALPIMAAGDPPAMWARIGSWYAGAFVLAALLLLLAGRRHHAALGLGSTMALAVLAGLGGVSLVLLLSLSAGAVWLVVVVLLVAAGDAPDRAARAVLARRERDGPALTRIPAVAAFGGTVFAAAGIATALAGVLSPVSVVVVAVITWVVGRAAVALWPLGLPTLGRSPPLLAAGGLLAAVGTMLLAAPLTYVVVRTGVA